MEMDKWMDVRKLKKDNLSYLMCKLRVNLGLNKMLFFLDSFSAV